MLVILWIVGCFLAAYIASNKGNSGLFVFLLSIFLSPIIGFLFAWANPDTRGISHE
jgi:hypothetical protein